MKRYKKWTIVGGALLTMGAVAGCGTTENGTTQASNPTANTPLTNRIAASNAVPNNTVTTTQSTTNNTTAENTAPAKNITLTSVSLSLVSGSTAPSISFKVPSGWLKKKEWQGDTSGYAWVDPKDQNEQIQVMTSGNMGAIQNFKTKQWDVEGIFGSGTRGITWSHVSSNKLSADFTDTTGINYFAKNEQTPFTGYGKAFIVKKPNPFSVYVEVWGQQTLASSVLPTVHLITSNHNAVGQENIQSSTTGTMPKLPKWNQFTSADANSKFNTDYGTVSASPLGITQKDISVSLDSSGVKDTLYTLRKAGFKQIDGWQTDGSYLALQFGFPPNAHPTTGDYGYRVVIINLRTKRVLLSTVSAVQSTDYLDIPYFVDTAFHTASNGTPEFYITITNLSAQTEITYQLPNNSLGNAVESGGVIYYKVVNGKKKQIISMVLPKTGWQSIKDNKWNPIQLPSKG